MEIIDWTIIHRFLKKFGLLFFFDELISVNFRKLTFEIEFQIQQSNRYRMEPLENPICRRIQVEWK